MKSWMAKSVVAMQTPLQKIWGARHRAKDEANRRLTIEEVRIYKGMRRFSRGGRGGADVQHPACGQKGKLGGGSVKFAGWGRVRPVWLQGLNRRRWTRVRAEAKTPQTGRYHAHPLRPDPRPNGASASGSTSLTAFGRRTARLQCNYTAAVINSDTNLVNLRGSRGVVPSASIACPYSSST